jgi:hypothetical protein
VPCQVKAGDRVLLPEFGGTSIKDADKVRLDVERLRGEEARAGRRGSQKGDGSVVARLGRSEQ